MVVGSLSTSEGRKEGRKVGESSPPPPPHIIMMMMMTTTKASYDESRASPTLPSHRYQVEFYQVESMEPLRLPTIDVNRTRATYRWCEHQTEPSYPLLIHITGGNRPPPRHPPKKVQPADDSLFQLGKKKSWKRWVEKIHLERIGGLMFGLSQQNNERAWGREAWVFPLQTLHLCLSHWWLFKSQSFLIGGF